MIKKPVLSLCRFSAMLLTPFSSIIVKCAGSTQKITLERMLF
ncbi:hypothetical protein B4098_3166 [Heyndrickxia coagulans]|uniref:Uncharacterized protein n=1 Tax=Heyndrickxia coagulans TaxID=1398 RepID=A0A150K5F9_HEYCO|nr:hypothetical protein B4098_3166 [Heyndrickxia coagulans]